MSKKFDAISLFVSELIFSPTARMVRDVLCTLVQFVLRIFILRPLALLCCMVLAVLVTIPVIVFINPSFTPDVLTGGLLRVQDLLPVAYTPLFLGGLLFELLYMVSRLTGLPYFWLNGAGQGKGR
ncbi:hypothetical protein [Citrobacter koseri]|uniref:hypothetical protein n=1 Tax=Citrobacter koseri TaxID=545 RepID=UPI003892BE6D